MLYTSTYPSPMGSILLAADEGGLTGLWFEGAKYFPQALGRGHAAQSTPVLEQAARWLDVYFSGREPDFTPPVHMTGTPFQLSVWALLQKIPYGSTVTYGQLAARLAGEQNRPRMSAQAVGGAVGHNPISILVPCHRVVGAGGSLTGYAGGVDKKLRLLTLEGADIARLTVPTRGTAL